MEVQGNVMERKAAGRFPELEDDPRYQEARGRLNAVQLKLAGINQEIKLIEQAQTDALIGRERVSELDLKASALLHGQAVAPVMRSDFSGELQRLYAERQLVRRAEEQGGQELRAVQQQVALEIVRAAVPEYRKLIRKQTNQVLALARIVQAEKEFREGLNDACGHMGTAELFPMVIGGAGHYDLKEPASWINFRLFPELVEHDFATADEVKELLAGGTLKV